LRPLLSIIIVVIALGACTNPNEVVKDQPFTLRFSQDTVLFDTLFTTINSITKRVRVYNDEENARQINSIRVAGGQSSPYRLIVNGEEGTEFNNQVILGGDSLQILVEANIDSKNIDNPFIVRDYILFEATTPQDDVLLLAWGQDANYLQDSVIGCNAVWDAGKPYVLLGSVLVDTLCSLLINAGAEVYAGFNTSFFVKGTLNVNGASDAKVVFRNDRLDEGFMDAPGQWEGIFFLEGSKGNLINYTNILNSRYGIWLGTPDADTIPDLILLNSTISNVSRTGIIAFTSDLEASNTLVHTCGEYSVANLAGGNYFYNHCTFANYPTVFFRDQPLAVFSDNIQLADNSSIVEDINLWMTNTIIYGTLEDELILNNSGGANFSAAIGHSLLKTTINGLDVNSNILNEDPLFLDIETSDYDIESNSPAVDSGVLTGLIFDINGNSRDNLPDIGAFENQQ
jgi:hypothetical protein